MTQSEQPAKQTIASRLVAAMGEIDVVTKEGKNQAQGYSYVRAADIANEVRKVLVKHGIAFGFDVVEEERWANDRFNKEGTVVGVMNYVRIVADILFEDSVTGEVRVRKARGWGQDVGEKAIYKAMTGALKYALRMNFIIPDESDPENDERTTPAAATAHERVQAIKAETQANQGPFLEADDLLQCTIKGVMDKETPKKHKYMAVTFNGRTTDGFNWASCWHDSLKPILKGAIGKPVNLRLTRKKSEDGRSTQYLNIEDILWIDGVDYAEGKPIPLVTRQLKASLEAEEGITA